MARCNLNRRVSYIVPFWQAQPVLQSVLDDQGKRQLRAPQLFLGVHFGNKHIVSRYTFSNSCDPS